MNLRIGILIVSLISFCTSFGQNCIHFELSDKFNFETQINRNESFPDSCQIIVNIIEKVENELKQSITYSSTSLFDNVFMDCESVKSLVTMKNMKNEAIDNYHGDLIIADLNFDSLEDFAIIKDSGGSSGTLYNFYIQDSNGFFSLDNFLTEKMQFFPSIIDREKGTLTTLVTTSAIEQCKSVYKFDTSTLSWTLFERIWLK